MVNKSTQPKSQKVPKLRFAGFSDVWEEKKLGELGKIVGGGTPDTANQDFWKGSIPWVSSSDLEEGNINKINVHRFITEGAIKNSATHKIPTNSILMVSRVGVGKMAITSEDVCTSQDFQNITPFKDKTASAFLSYYLSVKVKELLQYNQGTSIKGFTKKDLQNLCLHMPQLPEQQKIAEFLGEVDAWIENLRAQKENLDSYKKGMMQKIFSQEIRFKDEGGNEFTEWEEKKLGEVGEIVTGTTPPTSFKEYYGDVFPWITPTDIKTNKDIYTSAKSLTQKGIEKGRFIPRNSLLVTCIASIGKNAILRTDGSCNQQINAILPNNENVVDFLYYLLESNKNILIRSAGAGGMQMLNKKDFSNLKFEFPTLPEQQKIADFLGSIDKVLESKQQQITQAEQWKKGLMQGLFV